MRNTLAGVDSVNNIYDFCKIYFSLMKLLDRILNVEVEAEIEEVDLLEIKAIHKTRRFYFDWRQESKNQILKITIKGDDKVLGLISVSDIPDEYRIHINLLESSNENKGNNKEIDRIAGCLIAHTVKLAFEKGYLGFTSLVPKTELIGFYKKKYGFKQFGRQLAIDRTAGIQLMDKYL
ncbi:MAG: hypothetical protein F6K19_35985 [Cyanothece sp. SIO1E1]|nr:hypothetical protein [Cyanothece sp. SIO1E1]